MFWLCPQIEGAFVQGLGMFTLEEVRCSQNGTLWTTGPGTYKIPGFADIPVEFNVHLLQKAPNDMAIYSSKVFYKFSNDDRLIDGDLLTDSPIN